MSSLYPLHSDTNRITVPTHELITTNTSLGNKTWFKTGGPARFFCQPTTIEEFQQALDFARSYTLPLCVLGEGANTLISDGGFDGLVIRPQLSTIKRLSSTASHELIQADTGVHFQDLILWCLDNNLTGLEEFSGIPGTVGGSVFINIHYFEFLLSNFLVSAQVINRATSQVITVEQDWFSFGYNYSKLHNEEHYLVNGVFKLKKIDTLTAAYHRGRRDEMVRHRQKRYPTSGTCGSFFRNFYDTEVTLTSNGKKLIYVAYYLDKIGIKGTLSVGDAIVSYQHANMIVNRGNATTHDIITLAKTMQQLVYDHFGILPQPECRLVGFKEYPLIPALI
jgi:UDP-N-acetylmuramate dehydrogenase